jgi:hypothetical protein
VFTHNQKNDMKAIFLIKLWLLTACLLFPSTAQAQQQETEDVTVRFGTWQMDQGLIATSASIKNLTVKNTTGESIVSSQNRLNHRMAFLDLNWKEDAPFQISFNLSNEKTNPYTYDNDPVCWGILLELYGIDGSVVSNTLWLSANRHDALSDGKPSRYAFSTDRDKWENWVYMDKYIKDMAVRIIYNHHALCAGFRYSAAHPEYTDRYDDAYLYFAGWSNIAGIKSISILVGSEVEVSVKNFTVQRQLSVQSQPSAQRVPSVQRRPAVQRQPSTSDLTEVARLEDKNARKLVKVSEASTPRPLQRKTESAQNWSGGELKKDSNFKIK